MAFSPCDVTPWYTCVHSYIAWHLVLVTAQSALHFTRNIPAYSNVICVKHSATLQLLRRLLITYPPLSVPRNSFIQLSDLWQQGVNKIAQASKRQQKHLSPDYLDRESNFLTTAPTPLHLHHCTYTTADMFYSVQCNKTKIWANMNLFFIQLQNLIFLPQLLDSHTNNIHHLHTTLTLTPHLHLHHTYINPSANFSNCPKVDNYTMLEKRTQTRISVLN